MLNNKGVDPITVAVLDNKFTAIADEMANTMIRTSRSPIFAEARDLATAIFDKDLRLIVQREHLPILAVAIPVALKYMVKAYEGDINAGDVFIHNDSYTGGNHAPDVTVAKPVFHKGELLFWSAVKGHMVDIGGRGIGGYDCTATTVWDDGLRISCCKLYDRGKRNRGVWDLILSNTKLPAMVEGDIHCEVGAVTIAERALLKLIELYGQDTLYAAVDEIIAATGREFRDKIRQIPDGVYYGESCCDHDGITRDKPVTVRAKVIKQGDEITIDLSDSDPQVSGYVNSTEANTWSACFLAIYYAIPGEVKRNQGSLEQIKVITRKGTCVNPEFPASVQLCTIVMVQNMAEAIWLALAPAIPQWITAPPGENANYNATGINPRTKRNYVVMEFLASACGSGGTEGYDGWDVGEPTQCLGQMRMPDPEIMELVAPIHYLQWEQIGGMEGAGKFRGGHATAFKVQFLADCKAIKRGQGIRDCAVPRGLLGGLKPRGNKCGLHRAGGTMEELDVNMFFDIKTGDIYEELVMGGSGFGSPLEREPERVRKDVMDEWLSLQEAKDLYGVVIDPETYKVDKVATEKLRAELKNLE